MDLNKIGSVSCHVEASAWKKAGSPVQTSIKHQSLEDLIHSNSSKDYTCDIFTIYLLFIIIFNLITALLC